VAKALTRTITNPGNQSTRTTTRAAATESQTKHNMPLLKIASDLEEEENNNNNNNSSYMRSSVPTAHTHTHTPSSIQFFRFILVYFSPRGGKMILWWFFGDFLLFRFVLFFFFSI
jgi:hypothetical protein